MKISAKLLLVSSLILFVFSVQAQTNSILFMAGGSASDMYIKLNKSTTDIEDSYKMKIGYHGGILYDYVLKKKRNEELSFETGFIFDTKGVDQQLDEGEFTIDNTFSLYYIDVPVMLKYIYRFRSLNKIYFGAGPFVGLGLTGSKEYTYAYVNGEASTNNDAISWGNDPDNDFKRLDYGATAKVGFLHHNGFDVSVSYDYGIPNVAAASEVKTYKHRVLRLSIGYRLMFED